MVQRDYLFQAMKIKATSVFSMDELYKVLFKWFEVNDYGFHEYEFGSYDEPGGQHLEIFWRGEKKIDSYVKFVIEVGMLITGLNKQEIVKDGLKLNSNKGAIEFRISIYLLKDYDDKWGKHKKIQYLYDKIIAKKRIDRLEGELFQDSHRFIDEINSFLEMHRV